MPDTDVIHRPGADPDWNECFHFSFYDEEEDILGLMRIGLHPNRRRKTMHCLLMMPEGGVMGMMGDAPYRDTELNARGLVFQRIVPERRWKLMLNGGLHAMYEEGKPLRRASLMLDWEGLNPMFAYRRSPSWGVGPDAGHLEQFGRVEGALEIGGSRYSTEGLGERYHTWGPLHSTSPSTLDRFSCQFSEDLALNATRMVVGGETFEGGYLHQDGRSIPLRGMRVETEYIEGSPDSFELVLEDDEEGIHRVLGKVRKGAILELPGPGHGVSLMHETLARYMMDGIEGFGVAEYLIRERGGIIQIVGRP